MGVSHDRYYMIYHASDQTRPPVEQDNEVGSTVLRVTMRRAEFSIDTTNSLMNLQNDAQSQNLVGHIPDMQ